MSLPKKFYSLSKEEQITCLLNKYSCLEIATLLVEEIHKPKDVVSVSKISISQEDFVNHFRIIKKRVQKEGNVKLF